ncbi:MAG: hypothetical protein JWP25_6540, partial [Bradyrhizobium sp.]|nr:hypothetical protein [Bradyrhizobium sp.]
MDALDFGRRKNVILSMFPATEDEHAVEMMAFKYNTDEDRRRFNH